MSRSPSTRSAKLPRERWERRAEQGRCRATARRMLRPQNRAGSSAAGELVGGDFRGVLPRMIAARTWFIDARMKADLSGPISVTGV